jgi:hypothetical protein
MRDASEILPASIIRAIVFMMKAVRISEASVYFSETKRPISQKTVNFTHVAVKSEISPSNYDHLQGGAAGDMFI